MSDSTLTKRITMADLMERLAIDKRVKVVNGVAPDRKKCMR